MWILAFLLFCGFFVYRYNHWCKYSYDYLTSVYNFDHKVFAVINPSTQTRHIIKNILRNPQFVCGHPSNIAEPYKLVLCFGGDGTIHKTIQYMCEHQKLLVLPCGSSNGVATSLGIRNRSDALLALLRPITKITKIPLMNVTLKGSSLFAIMSIGWGAIADYDYYGENKLRFLGSLRSFIIPAIIIASCKTYLGEIELVLSNKKNVVLSGNFAMVHIVKMPNIAHDVCLDSECDPRKNLLHVFVIRKISRWNMINVFQNMNSLKNNKCVEMYICSHVKISPQNGNMAIDGEYIPTQTIEMDGNGKTIQMFTNKY
jgi:diacylglycerol kinase family enzyme